WFLPSRAPQLAIVVVVDSAKGHNGDHGGMVAAPIFRNIAEPALHYLGIAPTINPAPPVLVAKGGDAPRPVKALPPAEQRTVAVADGAPRAPAPAADVVPDLMGKSAREAIRLLVKVGMSARLSGDGVVVSQDPAAGEPIGDRRVCSVVLERWPAHRA